MPISLKSMRGCASPASTAIYTNAADHLCMPRRSHSHSHSRHPYTNLHSFSTSQQKRFTRDDDYLSRRKSSADSSCKCNYQRLLMPARSPPNNSTPLTKIMPSPPVHGRDLDRSKALMVKPKFTTSESRQDVQLRRPGLKERVIVLNSLPSGPLTPSPSPQPRPQPQPQQAVVLRVSLHCRGCEAKLRKHLSKMQGVTSFSIDLETKKVRVIGHVTPGDVLASIARVKNAQFWASPFPS